MALDNPKYERMFSETGSDDDKISSNEKEVVKGLFDENDYLKDKHKLESQGHLIYMLDKVTQELDYLRTKIAANESCCTTQTNRTHITTAQASAITANTAKITFPVTTAANNALSFSINGNKLTITNTVTQLGRPGQPTPKPQILTTTLNLK